MSAILGISVVVARVLFTAYIIHVGFFYRGSFNDIGGKTEDGTNPKQ